MLRRSGTAGFTGILCLVLSCSGALAQDAGEYAPAGRGTYVGVFGGGGSSSVNGVVQIGNALFPPSKGGPLDVFATGNSHNRGVGLVGLQIGHEWSRGPAEDG